MTKITDKGSKMMFDKKSAVILDGRNNVVICKPDPKRPTVYITYAKGSMNIVYEYDTGSIKLARNDLASQNGAINFEVKQKAKSMEQCVE